uniref:MATH domain-containing protein n=1 Tax=Panagrolaimus sp. ES5 TaxID=591445 RepID=A0AC34GCQ2_9BILA
MAHKTKLQSPVALKWTIPEARLKELKDSIDGSLCSKRFNVSNIPDVQYFLVIYPNGSKEDRRGQTWITLYLKCSDNIKIEAEFCIKVASANFEISSKHIFDKSFGRGGKCCTTAELFDPEKGFIVDGKLTTEMDGIFMTEKEEADE